MGAVAVAAVIGYAVLRPVVVGVSDPS
jgi:hypothetical protein